MTREGVELVKRVYSEGQLLTSTPEQIDRVFSEYLDEGFEFRLPPDYPEGQLVFRGREGVDQLNAMLSETWSEWRFEPDRFLDAGDQVVVFARLLGRGETSGAPFELETTHVWTLRAGRAISVQVYRERSQALQAAGLSE
jgi:ketosteroid isomerase-like protein